MMTWTRKTTNINTKQSRLNKYLQPYMRIVFRQVNHVYNINFEPYAGLCIPWDYVDITQATGIHIRSDFEEPLCLSGYFLNFVIRTFEKNKNLICG